TEFVDEERAAREGQHQRGPSPAEQTMRDRAFWGRQLNDTDREGGDRRKGVNLDDNRSFEERCERHEGSDPSDPLDRNSRVDKTRCENKNGTWSKEEAFSLSSASISGGSSGRGRQPMGYCRLASPRSTECCRAAGSRGAPCTRSWGWTATRRMARSPPPLPPA